MSPVAANTVDPATGQPRGSTAGLFQVVLSRDLAPAFPGHKEGDTVYVSAMSIAKDAAAPFWIDAVRVAEVVTLTPDSLPPATVDSRDGWFEVRLPQLHDFSSVKISLN